MRTRFYHIVLLLLIGQLSCRSRSEQDALFEVLDHKSTGLDFENRLTPTPEFNMFKYMYFYNGSGVGAGDFNNDGLIDLFFSANQQPNKIYLNKGELKFRDVTQEAKIPNDGGWSTGVSVTDVNNDGMLDIYVCRVGRYEKLISKNQLLVCQEIGKDGIPVYKDMADQYGLAFSGFSTQAAFFDYDLDGDLDMYLMNHSLRFNGTFAERSSYAGTRDSLAGDRLYKNEAGRFVDATAAAGINSTIIGYGLGICVADINLDGWPDIYIGNDFHENDYLYINQRNGTFKDELTERTMHISQFSMGVDVADVNNDALPEIVSVDMLPYDPYILRRSLGEDAYDIFQYKVKSGYHHQYARNMLQFNRGNGRFSDVGMYSGIHATDWSWAPLWMDFDNDGLKDLFISNGIPKRLNDIDYVNYVSNDEIQNKIRMNRVEERDMALIDKFPEIKLENKFFRNKGDLSFEEAGAGIPGSPRTYSNGAAYADLDNDGDLDIVVNNIDAPALIYRNKNSERKLNESVSISLKGPKGNLNATGARVMVFAGTEIRSYEKYPVRGFQSSMEVPVIIGLGSGIDSMILIWPDNTSQKIDWKAGTTKISISYRDGLPAFDYNRFHNEAGILANTGIGNRNDHALSKAATGNAVNVFSDITASSGLDYLHEENPFVEFDREPLTPRMVSAEGPALAVGDINGDSLDDVFLGASKGGRNAIFVQTAAGTFLRSSQPALLLDSMYEDVDASFVDVNNDRHPDLVLASGGNEYYGQAHNLLPRVYLNNGKGQFSKLEGAFTNLYFTFSCIEPYDFNGDGYVDLFLGGRAVPWEYGEIPRSFLLQNDGTGKFVDVTAKFAPAMANAGFVKDAVWADIDSDKDNDIILAMEWDGIVAFVNDGGKFSRRTITENKGWWNFVLPCDVDMDGDLDLVAGNLGLNNRLKATKEQPVKLYFHDFDNNGKREQILTYYLDGKEIPFANKAELEKQIPPLKKRFLYAEDFAKTTLSELLGASHVKNAVTHSAWYFSNAVLINDSMRFTVKALPWQAQLTQYNDGVIVDVNNDQLPDILLGGNFYQNNIQMGRYDADYGSVLVNRGKGNFSVEPVSGVVVRGQVRNIGKIKIGGRNSLILARNGDSVMVLRHNNK